MYGSMRRDRTMYIQYEVIKAILAVHAPQLPAFRPVACVRNSADDVWGDSTRQRMYAHTRAYWSEISFFVSMIALFQLSWPLSQQLPI